MITVNYHFGKVLSIPDVAALFPSFSSVDEDKVAHGILFTNRFFTKKIEACDYFTINFIYPVYLNYMKRAKVDPIDLNSFTIAFIMSGFSLKYERGNLFINLSKTDVSAFFTASYSYELGV